MNAITGVRGFPVPGWYADADGVARWWDGGAWGPAAPPRAEHSLAVISHLGWIAGGFIVSLAIRLTADKRDEFTGHHASEALNLQLIITAFNSLVAGAFILPIFGAVMTMDLRGDETLVPTAWLAWGAPSWRSTSCISS